MQNLQNRALLVWLNISTWSARKYDKSVSLKVNSDHQASSDAGRYNKLLLPGDAKSFKQLVAKMGEIRMRHYEHTLAWSDEGWRLLPTAEYMQYSDWLRTERAEVEALLDTFVAEYPMLKAQAQQSLGKLYKAEDYPDVSDIRNRFAIRVNYMPVPSQGDVRVDLTAEQISVIEAEIQAKVTESAGVAVRDAWNRLHETVQHIAERLGNPDAIFRDSLVTNARDLCGLLTRLNVTDDPALETMRRTVENELTAYDPKDLRDNKAVRESVAAKAQSILEQMSAAYSLPEAA